MLSEEDKAKLGKEWAEIFQIPKSLCMPNYHYLTAFGVKSPIGIYNMIMDMAKKGENK